VRPFGGGSAILAFVACAGCGASTEPRSEDAGSVAAEDARPACAAAVATGEYELVIVPMQGYSLGDRFALSADGHFAGFSDNMAYTLNTSRCDGVLTADEQARITAAVNAASLFCLTDWPESGADTYHYDVTIRTLGGPRESRFCGFSDRTHPEFDALIGAVRVPLRRVEEAGLCTGPAYPVDRSTDRCPAH